jgi:hypothetical protein
VVIRSCYGDKLQHADADGETLPATQIVATCTFVGVRPDGS